MAYEKIALSIENGVATLTLNDPGAMNAVSLAMLRELKEALAAVDAPDSGARCLVLTGTGRGFCAGANLADSEGTAQRQGPVDAGRILEDWYHPLLLRLRDLRMPFITSVNGAAAGVGMSFALMGDLVLAAESAYFLQAFRRIGLVPDGGSTWLLPRLVGKARAMELSLLGEKLPAAKALEWGLINRVYPDADLAAQTQKLAAELAAGPTVALSLIRKAYALSPAHSFEAQLHTERMLQREAGLTADFREGVLAFLSKRPAKFEGR